MVEVATTLVHEVIRLATYLFHSGSPMVMPISQYHFDSYEESDERLAFCIDLDIESPAFEEAAIIRRMLSGNSIG